MSLRDALAYHLAERDGLNGPPTDDETADFYEEAEAILKVVVRNLDRERLLRTLASITLNHAWLGTDEWGMWTCRCDATGSNAVPDSFALHQADTFLKVVEAAIALGVA